MRESVSFIVIAHKNAATISQCLSSAESQAEECDELIIVLNNPDPQTKSEAIKHKNWIILYESSQGPQYARNTGALNANKRILCFLDADISLPSKWRSQMLLNFEDPWVAIGQSKIKKQKITTCLNWIQRYQIIKFNSRFYFERGLNLKEVTLSLDTAAMMVRREWFSRVGGFDKELPRLEDTDFSLRVMYYGGDLFFEDRVCAYEMIDPNESLIIFFRNHLKSIKLLPLFNSKHLISFNLPLTNGIDVSPLRKIFFLGTVCNILFSVLEVIGLALSPFPIILSYSNYIEFRVNPKRLALSDQLNRNLRLIWVGGHKRNYDLRKKYFFKSLE
jgi:glycosyltransferase involved in cell wall biosynthesis